MGEAATFFRSDDSVLFPPAEYKHTIEHVNSDKDAPDIELIMCTAALRTHDQLLGKTLEAYQILIVLLQ
jgi:choline dehydrogenase